MGASVAGCVTLLLYSDTPARRCASRASKVQNVTAQGASLMARSGSYVPDIPNVTYTAGLDALRASYKSDAPIGHSGAWHFGLLHHHNNSSTTQSAWRVRWLMSGCLDRRLGANCGRKLKAVVCAYGLLRSMCRSSIDVIQIQIKPMHLHRAPQVTFRERLHKKLAHEVRLGAKMAYSVIRASLLSN